LERYLCAGDRLALIVDNLALNGPAWELSQQGRRQYRPEKRRHGRILPDEVRLRLRIDVSRFTT
jgi:hypothetical protein